MSKLKKIVVDKDNSITEITPTNDEFTLIMYRINQETYYNLTKKCVFVDDTPVVYCHYNGYCYYYNVTKNELVNDFDYDSDIEYVTKQFKKYIIKKYIPNHIDKFYNNKFPIDVSKINLQYRYLYPLDYDSSIVEYSVNKKMAEWALGKPFTLINGDLPLIISNDEVYTYDYNHNQLGNNSLEESLEYCFVYDYCTELDDKFSKQLIKIYKAFAKYIIKPVECEKYELTDLGDIICNEYISSVCLSVKDGYKLICRTDKYTKPSDNVYYNYELNCRSDEDISPDSGKYIESEYLKVKNIIINRMFNCINQ